MSTPYRPPMNRAEQIHQASRTRWATSASASTSEGGSRTWTSRPRDSTSSNSDSGRPFNNRSEGRSYDRPQQGYRNDRPSGSYRPSGAYDRNDKQESPKNKEPPKIASEDFPSLTPQPAVEKPKIPWAEMAVKKTAPAPVVEPKPVESGWSNVVVKMATQQSLTEAQQAEEKRLRLEREQRDAEATKAQKKGERTFHVPFATGVNRRPQYEEEDDEDYIPPPAYGNQTPLDDEDDYDYDNNY